MCKHYHVGDGEVVGMFVGEDTAVLTFGALRVVLSRKRLADVFLLRRPHGVDLRGRSLSEKLVALRLATGLSQVALAEELGMASATISKWESGVNVPDGANMCALLDLYGISSRSLEV